MCSSDLEAYIAQAIALLQAELQAAGVQAEVSGRPKHIYSIWNKMQNKDLSFDQLHDLRALRILVPELKDCYSALGVVHNLWQPIPREFDDYISRPKGNHYRSLHTAVIGRHRPIGPHPKIRGENDTGPKSRPGASRTHPRRRNPGR